MSGDTPTARQVARRRAMEMHHRDWRRNRADAITGERLAVLRADGRAYPHPAPQLEAVLAGEVRAGVALLVRWMVAGVAGVGRHRGVIASHRELSSLLGVSERTTGTIVRAACDAGLIEQQPWYRHMDGKTELSDRECSSPKDRPRAREVKPCYVLGPIVRAWIVKREQARFRATVEAGRSCQPSELQPSSRAKKVSPTSGDRSIASRSRQGETARAASVPTREIARATVALARRAADEAGGHHGDGLAGTIRGATASLERQIAREAAADRRAQSPAQRFAAAHCEVYAVPGEVSRADRLRAERAEFERELTATKRRAAALAKLEPELDELAARAMAALERRLAGGKS